MAYVVVDAAVLADRPEKTPGKRRPDKRVAGTGIIRLASRDLASPLVLAAPRA